MRGISARAHVRRRRRTNTAAILCCAGDEHNGVKIPALAVLLPKALDAYVKDWKAKVERFGPEVVREQAGCAGRSWACAWIVRRHDVSK